MILKNMYTRSISTRFCLLVAMVGILVLLAACGDGSTPSTSSVTTPTTVVNTPTPDASNTTLTSAPTAVQPTPTPTAVRPTPTATTVQPTRTSAQGSTLVVMIITNSDGSYSFSPAKLTINVGTTVIWKDVSSAPHTVTSDDGTTFDSGTVPVGGSFHFTFKTSGSFSYHCNIHPYMKATIIVV